MKTVNSVQIQKGCFFVLSALFIFSCRHPEVVLQPTQKQVAPQTPVQEHTDANGEKVKIVGFYLLNEGNMGSNKATLDYFDFRSGNYTKNIYAATNPNVVAELGDVGNDLQIYGNRLYAVINCSNFVEVMDARTAKHIGTIEIPNCRYITFYQNKAYVSSYAGPVQMGNTQIGYVAEIDTATLQILRKVNVGRQPDEMAIVNGKMYVANSGGYTPQNYERTVSVIDLSSFQETKRIEVGMNLHRIRKDAYGDLYVSGRGNYNTIQSNLYRIDTQQDKVVDSLGIACSNLCIVGDSLYLYSVEWSNITFTNDITYGIVNTRTEEIVSRNFITDGTEKKIETPYGVAVHPQTRDVFITDAGNYVTPGSLYCFSREGKMKWNDKVTTGDLPAHFAFRKEKIK